MTETTAIINIAPSTTVVYYQFQTQVERIKAYASERKIQTAEDVKLATEDLSLISQLTKSIEELRKEYVSPINEHLKSVNIEFKTLTEPLALADKTTRTKILAWRTEQERLRLEAEDINRMKDDLVKREAALNEGVITIDTKPVTVPEAPAKIVRTDVGNLGTTKTWKFEVENIDLVPREYLMPDMVKIGKVVRAGVNIPGIKSWQEATLRITT